MSRRCNSLSRICPMMGRTSLRRRRSISGADRFPCTLFKYTSAKAETVPEVLPSLVSRALALADANDIDGYRPSVTLRRGLPYRRDHDFVPLDVTRRASPLTLSSK